MILDCKINTNMRQWSLLEACSLVETSKAMTVNVTQLKNWIQFAAPIGRPIQTHTHTHAHTILLPHSTGGQKHRTSSFGFDWSVEQKPPGMSHLLWFNTTVNRASAGDADTRMLKCVCMCVCVIDIHWDHAGTFPYETRVSPAAGTCEALHPVLDTKAPQSIWSFYFTQKDAHLFAYGITHIALESVSQWLSLKTWKWRY